MSEWRGRGNESIWTRDIYSGVRKRRKMSRISCVFPNSIQQFALLADMDVSIFFILKINYFKKFFFSYS